MKTLVAYYSRTENTKRVAEALTATLNADIEAIVSDTKNKGKGRLAMQAVLLGPRENRTNDERRSVL